MSTRIKLRFLALWQTLTEVPGWPDAPRRLRVRRAIPVVLPVLAVCAVTVWTLCVTLPGIRAERRSFAPVVALESELVSLGSVATEDEAAGFAGKGAVAQRLLLETPKAALAALAEIQRYASENGWNATFDLMPVPTEPVRTEGSLFYFVQARGSLSPATGNPEPFASLLALTERFSSAEKRIELTRLALRADEEGRYAAEIQVRLACRHHP